MSTITLEALERRVAAIEDREPTQELACIVRREVFGLPADLAATEKAAELRDRVDAVLARPVVDGWLVAPVNAPCPVLPAILEPSTSTQLDDEDAEEPGWFRKTALVYALEWTGANLTQMARFLGDDYIGIDRDPDGQLVLLVKTLEGVLRFTPGYRMIRNKGGEHYGCAPDQWVDTYERASRPDDEGLRTVPVVPDPTRVQPGPGEDAHSRRVERLEETLRRVLITVQDEPTIRLIAEALGS